MTGWWKILCLDCGRDFELLTDRHNRVICRRCLDEHEFKEVEGPLQDIPGCGTDEEGRENDLPDPETNRIHERDSRDGELEEMDEE